MIRGYYVFTFETVDDVGDDIVMVYRSGEGDGDEPKLTQDAYRVIVKLDNLLRKKGKIEITAPPGQLTGDGMAFDKTIFDRGYINVKDLEGLEIK